MLTTRESRQRLVINIIVAAFVGCLSVGNGAASENRKNTSMMEEPATVLAGRAKVNITPDVGSQIKLSGYSSRKTPLKGVHDDLYVRAIAVSDGEDLAIYVSSDQLTISTSDVKKIYRRLSESGLNISPESLFIGATHTHGAPSSAIGQNADTSAYQRKRLDAIINAIQMAHQDMAPATVKAGSFRAPDYNHNRQEIAAGRRGSTVCVLGENPSGVSDKQIQFAEFARLDGTPFASITFASVHSTVLGEHNLWVTGDFAGAMASQIEERRGNDYASLWVMSGGGDQSPKYYHLPTRAFRDEIKSPEAQTYYLSEQAVAVMNRTPRLSDFDLRLKAQVLTLNTKKNGQRVGPIVAHRWNNDILFVGTPFELFSQTVIDLREKSKFELTFVSSLTNGTLYYLPTTVSGGKGCYENKTSLFPETEESKFQTEVLTLIDQLSD